MWTGERLYEFERRIDPNRPDGTERPAWRDLHPMLQMVWIGAALDMIDNARAAVARV